MWCDIYVGVIVWSVQASDIHTHSLFCGAAKVSMRDFKYVGKTMCTVLQIRCEAQNDFDRLLFFLAKKIKKRGME